ncbi:pyocin knob domain-containing protein [Pararhizobium sp. A13]|uniref:pyocin knob domain-containing protein n=1 Tax=Pararhizobium sp. A13 TaxID=3133975 RepID=UPI00324A38D5
MANDDLIRSGTASIANGQVAVTGQSVSWSNVRESDFFGAHVGLAIPIAAIAGSAITLAYPWPGPTQNAASYAIQPKGDVTRFQDRVRLLLETLSDGDLAAIAALTSAADKLPYFTGSAAAALSDFKAKGRDIVAADTMTALLAKLGPSPGHPSPVPSGADVGLVDGDFNSLIYPGTYTITGAWANGPSVYGAGSPVYGSSILEVIANNASNGYWQILRVNQSTWKRTSTTASGASWNAWFKIEHQLQGTVSQSSGIAIGSIFERGSNANGEYVKMADGTLICTHGMDVSGIAIATARGSLFGFASESLWTFPAAFVGVNPRMSYEFGRADVAFVGGGSSITKTLTSTTFVVWNSSSNPAGNNKTIYVTATGRWF